MRDLNGMLLPLASAGLILLNWCRVSLSQVMWYSTIGIRMRQIFEVGMTGCHPPPGVAMACGVMTRNWPELRMRSESVVFLACFGLGIDEGHASRMCKNWYWAVTRVLLNTGRSPSVRSSSLPVTFRFVFPCSIIVALSSSGPTVIEIGTTLERNTPLFFVRPSGQRESPTRRRKSQRLSHGSSTQRRVPT